MKCQYCESTEDVLAISPIWSPWGRNCFDFNWCKHDHTEYLCEQCEGERYEICSKCPAAIDQWHYGKGYLPEDHEGDPLCPECAEKEGLKLQ